ADLAGFAYELVYDRAMHHLEPSRSTGFADDDLRDVVRCCVSYDLLGDVAARDANCRSTKPLGEPQKIGNTVPLDIRTSLRPRRLDIDRRPRSAQMVGNAPSVTDQPRSAQYLADADENPLAGRPGARDRMRPHMREQLLVDPLRRPAQCELAQCRQV